MNRRQPDWRVKRILLTLESATIRPRVIESAVKVARAYGADLAALFVKTTDTANMAAMPFDTFVVGPGGTGRTIKPEDLEGSLDRLAASAKTMLADIAGSHVKWTFQIARGHPMEVARERALGTDLVAICTGIGVRPDPSYPHEQMQKPLLRLGPGTDWSQPVSVLYEGDIRILNAGYAIARSLGTPMTVMIAGGADKMPVLRRRVRGWMKRHPGHVEMVDAPAETADIAGLSGIRSGSLYVFGARSRYRGAIEAALADGSLLIIPPPGSGVETEGPTNAKVL